MSDVLVKVRHVRAAGLCARGAREWCRHHGVSWTTLLDPGVPAEEIEETGDEFGIRVAAVARKEAEDGRRAV